MSNHLKIACCILAATAAAQTPPADPGISAYFRMPGQLRDMVKYPSSGGYPYVWLKVRNGLTMTIDADGGASIGIAKPTPVVIRGEVPVKWIWLPYTWRLASIPDIGTVVCRSNGVPISEPADYQVISNIFTSMTLPADAKLSCDYSYVPEVQFNANPPHPGTGVVVVAGPDGTYTVSIDAAIVQYSALLVHTPGPCLNQAVAQGSFVTEAGSGAVDYSDPQYVYRCALNAEKTALIVTREQRHVETVW